MAKSSIERFARWLDDHRIGVLILSLILALVGGYLASKVKVEASYSNLLPPSQRSVVDLNKVSARARPFGTVNILLESSDVALRARAGETLAQKLTQLPKDLVAQLVVDDSATARYGWQHRFLWAKLDDLTAARDALRARIEKGKLDANPLYISLEDEAPADDTDRFDELDKQLAELEKKATRPEPRVSADGRFQLIAVQTTFAGSDARKANQLIAAIKNAIEETDQVVGRGVRYGLTGNITMSMHEHDSVLEGMALAAFLTLGLCAAALWIYYRLGRVVLAILWALAVGVAGTFAFATLTIGHLNVMTAFLFAIVIGNGINSGLILGARWLEEIRAGVEPRAAMPIAMAETMRGTLAAMGTAAIAYTSLLVTDFRGFRQFGAIAGIGMALTWITAYTVLPSLLVAMAHRGLIRRTGEPGLGNFLARLVPTSLRGNRIVIGLAVFVTLAAGAVTFDYIRRDPFTKDWRDLQSTTDAILGARAIDAKIKSAFDNRSMLAGQAYQVVIAVDDRAQVGPLVAKLRAADAARPEAQRWMRDARSIDDAIPPDQDAKLVVLGEIRALIDDPALQASVSEEDKARLAKLRPPESIPKVGDADVPVDIAWPFIEKDGTRGRLIVVRGAPRFNSFDVADRLEFAREVRALDLPAGALVAGEPLVVADIIETMERDAPKIILFALIGSILTVFVVFGVRRHAAVTLACGMAGVILMIAICALLGIKVHFLDLIALPITIGIGIDYAVNLAARDRHDGDRGPRHIVRTTGASVLLCSYTTAVGYGTLMLSANGGIRSFGLAALVGEVACIAMALIVAPVCLAVLRNRSAVRAVDAAAPKSAR